MTHQEIKTTLLNTTGLIDAHTHLGVDLSLYTSGHYPYAATAEDHSVRLAHTGISFACCFPWAYSLYYTLAPYNNGIVRRAPRSLSPYPYAFENERLCQEIYHAFPEYAGKLLPFPFFDPQRRVTQQVAGLRNLAARYPLFGLKTATSYIRSPVKALLRQGAPLLDFAAELNLPVTFHSSIISGDEWANVFDIIDVIRARPDVRFAIAHTCRFNHKALDLAATLPNCFVDLSALHIHCDLAAQNNPTTALPPHRFPSDYTHPDTVLHNLTQHYSHNLIWGSDTPAHIWKSRWRDANGHETWLNLTCTPTAEADTLRSLPPPMRDTIARANTLRFLFGDHSE